MPLTIYGTEWDLYPYNHVIHHLLPPRRELSYNIRQRHHDRQLDILSGQLRSRNFIYRMLFKDCY